MNNAQILAKCFVDLGVQRVFGFSGATILPAFHAIEEYGIDIVVGANEQSCAFAAGGYSRASSDVGVAVVTSGPAITNTLTAVADANADSIPLLVFAGQVAQRSLGTDVFQTINVESIFADAAKKVILVTELMNVEEVVKDAYFLAKSGKPGPVVIDFPFDVQKMEGTYKAIAPERFQFKYEEEHHLGEEQCRSFFELLQKSKRPLLYIGGGAELGRGERENPGIQPSLQGAVHLESYGKGRVERKGGLGPGHVGNVRCSGRQYGDPGNGFVRRFRYPLG